MRKSYQREIYWHDGSYAEIDPVFPKSKKIVPDNRTQRYKQICESKIPKQVSTFQVFVSEEHIHETRCEEVV